MCERANSTTRSTSEYNDHYFRLQDGTKRAKAKSSIWISSFTGAYIVFGHESFDKLLCINPGSGQTIARAGEAGHVCEEPQNKSVKMDECIILKQQSKV